MKTQAAEYQLVKPTVGYKDIFSHTLEQCEVACQVGLWTGACTADPAAVDRADAAARVSLCGDLLTDKKRTDAGLM